LSSREPNRQREGGGSPGRITEEGELDTRGRINRAILKTNAGRGNLKKKKQGTSGKISAGKRKVNTKGSEAGVYPKSGVQTVSLQKGVPGTQCSNVRRQPRRAGGIRLVAWGFF